MVKSFRIALVAIFAIVGGMSVQAVSAQMMHFTLNVVVQTEDGAELPGGQVCVSGEVNPICQDIGGNPSGREFSFPGLADGDHDITVSGADPYLDIADHVTLTEDTTTVTETLQLEQAVPTAVATAAPDAPVTPSLPNTGAGATTGTSGSNAPAMLMVISILAIVGFAGSVMQLRKRR
ncbi:MAG: hypothetical protein ACR2OU_15700 [Thermomicrobiales bacterium]